MGSRTVSRNCPCYLLQGEHFSNFFAISERVSPLTLNTLTYYLVSSEKFGYRSCLKRSEKFKDHKDRKLNYSGVFSVKVIIYNSGSLSKCHVSFHQMIFFFPQKRILYYISNFIASLIFCEHFCLYLTSKNRWSRCGQNNF